MSILGHEPLKKQFVNDVTTIADIRNSFVHYKWPTKPFDVEQKDKDKKTHAAVTRAESAIRYLKRVTDKRLYRNHGPRIRRILKTKPKLLSSPK